MATKSYATLQPRGSLIRANTDLFIFLSQLSFFGQFSSLSQFGFNVSQRIFLARHGSKRGSPCEISISPFSNLVHQGEWNNKRSFACVNDTCKIDTNNHPCETLCNSCQHILVKLEEMAKYFSNCIMIRRQIVRCV